VIFGGLSWKHAELVHLVWAALALIGLLAWAELRGKATLGRFLSAVMQHRLADRETAGRKMTRLGFCAATLVLGILALMRPQTTGDTESISSSRVSADILVVLDVSKSMLAEDAAPTRLARAKAEVSALVDELSGHRIGLVVFAGRAAVLSPLTPDYGFFRMILRGAQPTSVSRGGTKLGEAIFKGLEVFEESTAGSKLMLLITDGEDHDSYAMDAANEAKAAGIKIVAIGFGSETGSPITLVDPATGARTSLIDPATGAPVISRLNGEMLRNIALATDGVFVPAGVAALDLESIVDSHIEPLVRDSTQASERIVPGEQYAWFVLGALVCLVIAAGLGAGRRGLP
jgi:Ca-activated chloride channel family protein